MKHRAARRSFLASLAVSSVALAQLALSRDVLAGPQRLEESPAQRPVVLEGVVLDADGAPARGARVASSAGGDALADAAGLFRIEAEVPLGAHTVELTALGAGGGAALARVDVSAASGAARSATLALSASGTCAPGWVPTFGIEPGVSIPDVRAFATYDDGGGPALYVGGFFRTAGGVSASGIAKWDGSRWSALPGVPANFTVVDLEAHDDGSGPALFAVGSASGVWKWNGSSWTSASLAGLGIANSLAVHDDGTGPALYAAHWQGVARWNGATWTAVGGVFDDQAETLATYDDGGGPALYAGGWFTSIGGAAASRIARWNGSSWEAVGSGLSGAVFALAAYDDGAGEKLYAGGRFLSAGTAGAKRIASWNGAAWSPLGAGLDGFSDSAVFALAAHDGGSGPRLYVGGNFTNAGTTGASHLASWNGSWSKVGASPNRQVQALASGSAGGEPALFAGGLFTEVGGQDALGVARFGALGAGSFGAGPFKLGSLGRGWSPLGKGLGAEVDALARFDDGAGEALYAAGRFVSAGRTASGVARWDGRKWSPLGGGVTGESVLALATFDDGGGDALYAGGEFTSAGGVPALNVAKWDGAQWSALGTGIGGTGGVLALAVHDDGGGPALYAAGGSSSAGWVRRFDGVAWTLLATTDLRVHALLSHDDNGTALYACGEFTTISGVAAKRIARWSGASWSALGAGLIAPGSAARSMVAYDDGGGPGLYVTGSFLGAGGAPAGGIARWRGGSWSSLGILAGDGVGVGGGGVLAVHDDGSGPVLYVGGPFVTADGVAASRIARWDGSAWSALGGGTSDEVRALAVFDGGEGPALHAGGWFPLALDSGDAYLARWALCPP